MNRNTPTFESNPINVDISRSTFNRDCSIKTSFIVGEVVPMYVDEVLLETPKAFCTRKTKIY